MLGDHEITALSDGTIDMPMTDLYHGLPKDQVVAYLAEHFQSVPTRTSVNVFLINTGDSLVLIDAGAADLMGPSLGKLVSNLEA